MLRALCVYCAPLVVAGCDRTFDGVPASFVLEQVSPRAGEVLLNQTLTLHFSEPVDPMSVTRTSLSIVDEEGAPARGTVRVDGSRVQFVPDPPLAADLSDGGLRHGTRYRLEARGFPHLDGLRSVEGRPMRSTYRWSFVTVPWADDPRELFFERERSAVEPLWLVGSVLLGDDWWLRMRAGELLTIQSGRPILPSSVRSEDFELARIERTGSEPVPLEARLVENHDAGAAVPLGTARIELLPHRELTPGFYELALPSPDGGPRDLAGNLLSRPHRPLHIEVFAYGEEHGVHEEDFLDAEHQSPQAVPGFDGTASWAGDGVVTVRFPNAAGDGSDGHVELTDGTHADVQALSIVLAAEQTAQLDAPGLVILRAQRRIALHGALVRSGEAPAAASSWNPGERLTDWLARAIAEDSPWTVIIAGGDLVIDGRVETSGPLLLVAGGAIRVTGGVRAQDRQLWLLGRGGGQGLDRTRSTPPLVVDAPRQNRLLEPLTCAVLSEPLPAVGEVGRWLAPRAIGRDGGGTWRVRYVPAELPGGTTWTDVAEDAPWQVEPLGRLRLLIELTVHPWAPDRTTWSPPLVDAVELHWEL